MNEPTAILVVGLNRSGTKWLSNILCNHQQIAGIQSERARGIIETNLFHRMQEKFDLRSVDDYVGFIEMWRKSEFFQQTGENTEYLYGMNPRPLDFIDLFARVMERYAERCNAKYWLQKCDPQRALTVLGKLPTARVVCIRRDTLATAQSLQQLNFNRGQGFSLLKSLPGLVRNERLLRRVENAGNCTSASYDQLRADPESCVKMICDALQIEFQATMLDIPYAPNTSYKTKQRPPPLPAMKRAAAMAIMGGARLTPMWALNKVLGHHSSKHAPVRLVQGTFGDLKEKVADRADYYR